MVRVSVYQYQKLDARKPLGQDITTNQEAAPQTARRVEIHTAQQVPRTVSKTPNVPRRIRRHCTSIKQPVAVPKTGLGLGARQKIGVNRHLILQPAWLSKARIGAGFAQRDPPRSPLGVRVPLSGHLSLLATPERASREAGALHPAGEAAASGCQVSLLLRCCRGKAWRQRLAWGLVGWGSQLPLARAGKIRSKPPLLQIRRNFFSLSPPNTSHPPSAQIYFSRLLPSFSLSLFLSSSLHLPSILSSCSRERPSQPSPCLSSRRRFWACR